MARDQLHKLVDDLVDLRQALVGDRVPPAKRRHFRPPRKAALLGVRTVVDHALAHLEEAEAKAEAQTVPVEE